MANKVIDINGPINATTSYFEGTLVGRNVKISLPEITHKLATIMTALGETEIPLYGLIDAMEATIQKIGADYGLAKICELKNKSVEFRWVQQQTKTDGTIKNVGCKAFLRLIPKVVPGIEVNPGDSVELDIPCSCTRYQLFVDGKELWLVDKLAGICRINGKDTASSINSLL